jgi:hypothetical protein
MRQDTYTACLLLVHASAYALPIHTPNHVPIQLLRVHLLRSYCLLRSPLLPARIARYADLCTISLCERSERYERVGRGERSEQYERVRWGERSEQYERVGWGERSEPIESLYTG